jgi:hypothetical protein
MSCGSLVESFKFKASKSCDAQRTPTEFTAGMASKPQTTHMYEPSFTGRHALRISATKSNKLDTNTANKLHVVKNALDPSAGTGNVDDGSHSPPTTMPVHVGMAFDIRLQSLLFQKSKLLYVQRHVLRFKEQHKFFFC